jgi:hypothetical protein
MLRHLEEQKVDAVLRAAGARADYADLYARLERATNALAEYAMRLIEEVDQ